MNPFARSKIALIFQQLFVGSENVFGNSKQNETQIAR
jgi:hypothetical protein